MMAVTAFWQSLPFALKVIAIGMMALVLIAPLWRAVAWWWDLWNGLGSFYDRLLPVVR